jgi:hypothetical protein
VASTTASFEFDGRSLAGQMIEFLGAAPGERGGARAGYRAG